MTMSILPTLPVAADKSRPLDAAAVDRLEASFLEEMMKYMGPTGAGDAGSGGTGESEFQSFLTQYQAQAIAARLDLGLVPGRAR